MKEIRMAVISVTIWQTLRVSELVRGVNAFPLFPVREDGKWLW